MLKPEAVLRRAFLELDDACQAKVLSRALELLQATAKGTRRDARRLDRLVEETKRATTEADWRCERCSSRA